MSISNFDVFICKYIIIIDQNQNDHIVDMSSLSQPIIIVLLKGTIWLVLLRPKKDFKIGFKKLPARDGCPMATRPPYVLDPPLAFTAYDQKVEIS